MMYHKDKKIADGCNRVDKSKERMDVARCAGGALENRCGNDLSDRVSFGMHVIEKEKKSLRVPDKMGGQYRASRANLPDVASKPFGERIHKLLVLGSRSWWRRSNCGDLLPRGLLGNNLTHLTILRLITMISIIRLPA